MSLITLRVYLVNTCVDKYNKPEIQFVAFICFHRHPIITTHTHMHTCTSMYSLMHTTHTHTHTFRIGPDCFSNYFSSLKFNVSIV